MNPIRKPSALDHALMAFGSGLAIYAGGTSIGRESLGIVLCQYMALASILGYFLSRLVRSRKIAGAEPFLYAGAALSAIVFSRHLNELLPDHGYPFQLILAGAFSWSLILGSLFSWNDGTLCFQAVPSIAVFGLVGSFDTFKTSPALFFVFLMLYAALFFRAHTRNMLAQAAESIELTVEKGHSVDEEVQFIAFQAGAWRWMAGPIWAIASALLIILLSVVGAPVLKASVESVVGSTIVLPSLPKTTSNPLTPGLSSSSNLPVGRGPASLLPVPVAKIKMSRPYLVGQGVFYFYRGTGWDPANQDQFLWRDAAPTFNRDTAEWTSEKQFPEEGSFERFQVEILSGAHDALFFPGELLRIDPVPFRFGIRPDSTVKTEGMLLKGAKYSGQSFIPSASPVGHRARPPDWQDRQRLSTDSEGVKDEVRNLAVEVTRDATSDYERAIRIKSEIESRCRYNLNASAVPPNRDAAQYFLFESKEGYCDLFATAMAIMARSVSLPARVRTGFLVTDTEKDQDGFYTLKASDYHAWAEIYFRGVGWVPFDATEGAQEVDGGGRGTSPPDKRPWYEREWVGTALNAVIISSALVAAAVAIRSIRRSQKSGRPRVSAVGKLFRRFQQILERKTRKPRRLSQTPKEYLARIEGDLSPEASAIASELVLDFEKLLFGPSEPSKEDQKELGRKLRELAGAPKVNR